VTHTRDSIDEALEFARIQVPLVRIDTRRLPTRVVPST
jgi:hypothetical protein